MTIECKYSCKHCGIYRQAVQVPVRQTEDVITWMNTACVPLLGADHDRRSPFCRITELTEVMIPVPPGTDKIGGPPLN